MLMNRTKCHCLAIRKAESYLIYEWKKVTLVDVFSWNIILMLTALMSISSLWIMMRGKRWSHASRSLKKIPKFLDFHSKIKWSSMEIRVLPAFVLALAFAADPLVDAFPVHWRSFVAMLDFDFRIHLCVANAVSNDSTDVVSHLLHSVRVHSLQLTRKTQHTELLCKKFKCYYLQSNIRFSE